jgi:putative ABC transport system substrate-binding protein
MAGKWIELLKGVSPSIKRIAYLFNPKTAPPVFARSIESMAPLLSIELLPVAVDGTSTMERMIEQLAPEDTGLLVLPDIFTTTNRQLIIALAGRRRLAALYPFKFFAFDGGLMSYAADVLETYRQAASYVDRVLRGTNPADLPIQQPSKFEFVINLRTAKALNLELPPSLLAIADEVIE